MLEETPVVCTAHHLHITIQETVIRLTAEEAQVHLPATLAIVAVAAALDLLVRIHDPAAAVAVEVLEALLEAVAAAEDVNN